MKSTAAILLVSFICMGASCQEKPDDPPVPVEVKVATPVPCDVPEPQCQAPAYDSAKKTQPMDDRVKLLRVESIEREDCLRQYRDALTSCRTLK